MKNFVAGSVAGILLTAIFAFKSASFEPGPSSAEVVEIEDLYIFTDSRPVLEYDTLGTVELTFVLDTQYESIRNNFIKKAKSKFPDADALIMNFNAKGIDKCEVIKFKE